MHSLLNTIEDRARAVAFIPSATSCFHSSMEQKWGLYTLCTMLVKTLNKIETCDIKTKRRIKA